MKPQSFQEPVRIERVRAKKYCPGEYTMIGSYKLKRACIDCGFCKTKARRLAELAKLQNETNTINRINQKCKLAKEKVDDRQGF